MSVADDPHRLPVQPERNHQSFRAIREFGIHSFVGTSLFAVIATPAVGCDFAVKWLAQKQVSEYVIYGLNGAEVALFACDLTLFVTFLVRTSIRHARLL